MVSLINQDIVFTMRHYIYLLILLATPFFMPGCNTTSSGPLSGVGYEFDSEFDLPSAKTFAVILPESPSPMSSLMRKRILQEVARQLQDRGYTRVAEQEKADLWITVHGTSRQVIDTVTYSNVYYTRTYRRGGWIYHGGYPGTFVTTREEGTLMLDVIDAKSKELVWRGYGTQRMIGAPGEVAGSEIYQSVRQLLVNFPIREP
jgi:hypothetical protein